MKTIDVCLSPELLPLYDVRNRTVVVVDVLRATSCMVTALAHGAASITPIADLETCRDLHRQGFITAGERNGEKVAGFDKGNSPFEYMHDDIRNQRIAFTTTNGTQAIDRSRGAREVVIGSFLNLSAVTRYLLLSENNILVVCAGWKGKVNLEDSLFAGAVVDRLRDHIEPDCDAPLMARDLYLRAKDDLVSYLSQSSHVKRLHRLNIHRDIVYCLTADQYAILPRLVQGELRVR